MLRTVEGFHCEVALSASAAVSAVVASLILVHSHLRPILTQKISTKATPTCASRPSTYTKLDQISGPRLCTGAGRRADQQIPDDKTHLGQCTRSALMGVIVSIDFGIWG